MGDEGILVLTFDEILAGAAGPQEAAAAQRWIDAGAPVQPLPSGLVALDPHGFDMRVAGAQSKRRRVEAVQLHPPATFKQGQQTASKPAAAASVPQQQTPAQRLQQVQQPETQQEQQRRTAAASGSTQGGPFSQAGNSNVTSFAVRRKGGGPVEFVLPAGWRQLSTGASGSPCSVSGGKAAKPSKAAGPGKKQQAKQVQHPQPQQQAAFVSPEGLQFSSLLEVQNVVEGPVVVPRKLVRWLRQVAANPMAPAALDAPSTTIGRAHLLAARRARVATHAADRQQREQRLAVVAAEQASAERQLRRRSHD